MINRFGFHILGGYINGHESEILDWCGRYHPKLIVIQDNDSLGNTILNVSPDTLIAQKRWRQDEATCWQWQSPADFVAYATTQYTMDKRQLVYVLNEPAVYGDAITTLCNWLIAVGRECTARGYRAVLGNIGPATVQPSDIDSGNWDDYLRYLAGEGKDAGHFGGWHEYTGFFLPFGAGQYIVEDLKNPSLLQPPWHTVQIPTNWQQTVTTYLYNHDPFAVYPGWWHLLRSQWFELYAASKGIGKHNKLITEFGWDDMPDLEPTGIKGYLTQTYGIPNNDQGEPYHGLRGIRTLENIWRGWWPDWSLEEAAYQQLVWADQNYPDDYIGFAMFTISWGTDWDLHWGFNAGALPALHEKLINHVEPEPSPDNEPPDIPEDPIPPTVEWWKTVSIAGGALALVLIAGLVFVIVRLTQVNASIQGVGSMEIQELLTALWQIPPIAAISYTGSIVLVLVEVWKRYLYPRLPEGLRFAPEVVAIVLVTFFLVVNGLAAQYAYDDAFKEVVVFITKILDAIGPYFLTSVLGVGFTNYTYNKLRGSETPGFNAVNPAKK